LTHNCKLSHGEWKAFGLDLFKPNTWNWNNFLPFWPEFIQAKPAICLDF
jgi:hypothetical protein